MKRVLVLNLKRTKTDLLSNLVESSPTVAISKTSVQDLSFVVLYLVVRFGVPQTLHPGFKLRSCVQYLELSTGAGMLIGPELLNYRK